MQGRSYKKKEVLKVLNERIEQELDVIVLHLENNIGEVTVAKHKEEEKKPPAPKKEDQPKKEEKQ